jgi:endonuclease III
MIIPTEITNFARTDEQLEEFMLFCIAVAGKRSDMAAGKVNDLMTYLGWPIPFAALREQRNRIGDIMRHVGIGPYEDRMIPATCAALDLDLRACSLRDLLSITGVGHKTARMFILHSRPQQEYVVLDVHILRWLRGVCRMRGIPRSTPGKLSPLYESIEARAKRKVREMFPSMNFAEFDLATWTQMSGRAQ